MASLINQLTEKNLIKPPQWLPNNVCYETIMGSYAYGVSNDMSDTDIYGFAIPPKNYVFPHLNGGIPGFSKPGPSFNNFQQHHVYDEGKEREYDFDIFNIVKYFALLADNNPNVIDSLFTPEHCVIYINQIGNHVKDNRHKFLSKKCWFTFKGYARSQHKKINNKKAEGKRVELIEKYGYDTKFSYHLIRLLNEVEQILLYCDLNLIQGNEQLKFIREGGMSLEELNKYFEERLISLEYILHKSKLQEKPNHEELEELLMQCLEIHYGSLDKLVMNTSRDRKVLQEIQNLVKDL